MIGVREPQPAASEAFVKFADAHRSIEKFGIRLLKTIKPVGPVERVCQHVMGEGAVWRAERVLFWSRSTGGPVLAWSPTQLTMGESLLLRGLSIDLQAFFWCWLHQSYSLPLTWSVFSSLKWTRLSRRALWL